MLNNLLDDSLEILASACEGFELAEDSKQVYETQ